MKPISVILFLLAAVLMVSCKNPIKKPVEKIAEQVGIKKDSLDIGTNDDFFTKLNLIGNDSIIDKMTITNAAIYLARKYYNEITDINFITSIDADYKYTTKIEGYGNIEVLEVNIKGRSLSNATPKKCYLLYCKGKEDAFVFNFSQFFLIKCKVPDTGSIVGGIVITKGVGYFLCYSFKDSSFVKIFDSGFDVDENAIAIPVYLNNGGCIKYADDFLKFQNTDINHDGLLDFSFYGTLLYYCKPNEYETDANTNTKQPINHRKIKINYLRKNFEAKPEWVLSDTTEIKQALNIR